MSEIIGKQIKDLPVWVCEALLGGLGRHRASRLYLSESQFVVHNTWVREHIALGYGPAPTYSPQTTLLPYSKAVDITPADADGFDVEAAFMSDTGGLTTLVFYDVMRRGAAVQRHKAQRLMEWFPHSVRSGDLEIFVPDPLPPGVFSINGLRAHVEGPHGIPYRAHEFVDRPIKALAGICTVFHDNLPPASEPSRPSRARQQADVIDVPVKVKDPIKLSFASAGDFLDKSYMQWRVQDFLPATGVAMIYGASQSGKTLLGIDLAGAVLNGRPWLGQPTEKAPVAYAALEGAEGFRDRVKAYAKHHGKNSLADLKVLDKTFSLTDRDHLDVLIKQLRAIGYREGIFIIDTLSVVAHGDLNQNSFGSEVYRACKRIVDALGGLVLLVHHTGKDEDKGAKGASSITQHIDTILKVEDRRGMRAVKIEKQRDGDTSQKLRFAVKPVAIGQDDRGKTVTSVIAVEDHYGKVVLRGHNQDALDILDDLVETAGRTPDELQLRDKVGLSEGTRLITKDEWKNAFLDAVRTTTDKQKDTRRKAFDRAFSALGDLGFYGFHGDFIYLKK